MTAPGWYPDPTGRFELRYFDGATWSSSVSRAGQQFVDIPPGQPAPLEADASRFFGSSTPIDGEPSSPFQPQSPFAPTQPFPPSQPFGAGGQVPPSQPFGAGGQVPPSQPFGSGSSFPPSSPFPAGPYAGAPAPSGTNGLAVTALVLGIIGCVAGVIPFFFVIAFLLGALAVVFGALGRTRREGQVRSKMATTGLILGVVSIGLGVVGVVILNTVIRKVTHEIDQAFTTVLPSDETTADPTGDTTDGRPQDTTATNGEVFDTQQLTITGGSLPRRDGSAAEDAAVGAAAPIISGTGFDGAPLTIGPGDGPYMVVFLAHWCPHCNAEIPRLQEWYDSGAVPAGFQVYGITTATDRSRVNYPPQPWLEDRGWPWRAMPDQSNGDGAPGAAATAFGVDGFPYMVLVGADGTVRARTAGEIEISDLQVLVDRTVSGGPAATTTTVAVPDKPVVSLPPAPPTALKVTTLVAGSGPALQSGDTVSVFYVGVLSADGTEFDGNYDRGEPFTVTIGVGQLIEGWEVGMVGLQAGGRYQLDIPPEMAYGIAGNGNIPSNAALTFVVDIVSITPA